MAENAIKGLTPTRLRIVLVATILLLVAIAGAGYWFVYGQLTSFAQEVSKEAVEANASANDLRNLQQLENRLKEEAVAITRTKNIVAESQSYQYQDQIIKDLSLYAKTAGVAISGYSFDSVGATTAAPAPAPAPGTTALPAIPAGLKTSSISVTLKTPVNYKALMRFVHAIELNLTKMQLTGISITQTPENKETVSVNPLTIEVYIKQ